MACACLVQWKERTNNWVLKIWDTSEWAYANMAISTYKEYETRIIISKIGYRLKSNQLKCYF
ncbi:hypothetical protein HZS_437 [Henneguya salminicola]|nr:hypothetical protein HZS_437 [Henneguya salminicola]